ncbi:MAG TPA: hypothetical protein VMT66_01160 [Steroidobacteraceae bacterium]|nr:hypothetical protein [Steroidobacteraceae bacterium]
MPGALFAQHTQIAHAAREAHAIEELEDLDRALAAETHRITKLRSADARPGTGAGLDDAGELRYARRIVEQITHHLVNGAAAELLAQHGAHARLGLAELCGELAHPRGVEATRGDERLQKAHELLILRRQLRSVPGQVQPRSVGAQLPFAHELIEQRAPQGKRHLGEAHAPQARRVRPRFIGCLGMEASQCVEHPIAQCLPPPGKHHVLLVADLDHPHGIGQRHALAAGEPHEIRHPRSVRRALDERRESAAREHGLDGTEPGLPLRRAPTALWRERIEHLAATDGVPSLGVPENEAIARYGTEGRLEDELHPLRNPGAELGGLERHRVSHTVRGPQVHVHRGPGAQRCAARGEQLEPHIEAQRGRECPRLGQPVPARERALVGSRDVQGATLAGVPARHGPLLRVDAANAHRMPGRHDVQRISRGDAPAEDGAGRHGAVPGEREDPIHREAEQALRGPGRRALRQSVQVLAQCAHTGVVVRRGIEWKERRIAQRAAGKQCVGLTLDLAHAGGIDAVDLGERDGAAGDAEQAENRQMLARLRHDAVVGRDHEQREVDATGTGEHGMHQPLMARHIDETEHVAVGERRVGVAELDRYPPCLLFRQTVRVDASERVHERGLAVIDVTCRADDHESRRVTGAAPRAARGTLPPPRSRGSADRARARARSRGR